MSFRTLRSQKYKEKYAVVENNPSMLHFYGGTIVNEEGLNDNTISRYIFEFVNFNDLPKRCGKGVSRLVYKNIKLNVMHIYYIV